MGTLPEGWREVRLGDILSGKGYIRGPFGSSLKRDEMKQTGTPVYEQQHAIYNTRKFRFYIDESKLAELKRFVVKTDDLIISCSGTVGKISIIKDTDPIGIISQALLLLRVDTKKVLPEYLLYFFQTKYGFNSLINASQGSVQINIAARDVVERINLILPPLLVQKGIVASVSAFDKKIELLQKQNKILESLAQTLFKHWFIYFEFPDENGKPYKSSGGGMKTTKKEIIPENWHRGTLGEEFTITMGQSPGGDSFNLSGNGTVFFQGRTDFTERYPKVRLYTTEPSRIAKKNDVLVSVRAPVGDVNVADQQCCIGRGLAAVNSISPSYSLHKLKSLSGIFQKFESEGTVFGSITKDGFNNINTVIPDAETIELFEKIVGSFDSKYRKNYLEIQTLTNYRELLLPKLMRGEIIL